MSEFVISTRYANALMAISEEKNSFSEVLDSIKVIKDTLVNSKDLRNFLSNPIVKSTDKSDALKSIFGENVSPDVSNFLEFLVSKGRENILMDISNRFISISNKKLNQVEVNITSAIDLNEVQKDKIKSKLEIFINKKIIPRYSINNDIIGGFKARFDDTVVDASIQHQLEILKKTLFKEDFIKN